MENNKAQQHVDIEWKKDYELKLGLVILMIIEGIFNEASYLGDLGKKVLWQRNH
jgi:hypothetical protein